MSVIRRYSSRLQFIIIATVLGNVLQWFDFSLFGMMLPLFMKLFFPDSDSSFFFILFAIGSFARPLGGLAFGYLGDTSGRKTALVRTILFMTIPILLVALLPSYNQIGIASSILLAVIFLFQGFCVGGEFPGSIVFLLESAPSNLRGYIGSWSYFGVTLGMFFVAIDIYEMEQNLSAQDMVDWGWRLPFFMGAIIGIVGVCMRHFLHETPIFQEAKAVGHLIHSPLLDTFKRHKKMLLKGFGIYILDAVGFNLIIIFSNFYFTEYFQLSLNQSFRVGVFTVFLVLILLPIMGKLGNHIGNVRLAKWGAWGMLIFVLPAYLLMGLKTLMAIYLAQAILSILLTAYVCNMPKILFTLYPTAVRYTCIGVAINFTVAIFGGTAPLFIHKLIHLTHFPALPAIYLMVGATIALLSLRTIKSSHE